MNDINKGLGVGNFTVGFGEPNARTCAQGDYVLFCPIKGLSDQPLDLSTAFVDALTLVSVKGPFMPQKRLA